MKLKTVYICQECQHQATKWAGQCSECQAWNSFIEDVVNVGKKDISKTPRKAVVASTSLSENPTIQERLNTSTSEFDRVMGGGIAKGSITLLSGEPGIGKSTLTIQIANQIAKNYANTKHPTLIISGEESVEQIAARAHRLKLQHPNLKAINEHNLENILEIVRSEKPQIVIIDSIQVISSMDLPSAAGSITQIRHCTEQVIQQAKSSNTPVILIGHVTKEGNLAGPRVLEHLVDTVIQLEGDRFQEFRVLRAAKNRFGSCSEVGIFEMKEEGMVEIKNPSAHLLSGRKDDAIGSAINVTIEGTRPLLIEVQALVSKSPFGYPKRTANGFDLNRLQLLIAVLEKYGRLNLQDQDVFINVVGGMKLNEPAADLAVLMAIASSFTKKPIPKDTAIFGEVGLSGELRKTTHHQKRLKEAEKMGFKKIISPEQFKEVVEIISSF